MKPEEVSVSFVNWNKSLFFWKKILIHAISDYVVTKDVFGRIGKTF